jgi:hypothetical protein
MLVLLLMQLILTPLMILLRKDKTKFMNKLIKYDCILYERTKPMDNYFIRKADCVKDDNINSSRQLNEERNEDVHNEFNQNNNDLTVLAANKTQEIEFKRTDIHIYNNRVYEKENVEQRPNEQYEAIQERVIESDIKFTEITVRDYEPLTLEEKLKYDRRSSGTYFLDSLISRNVFLSVFLKYSSIDPLYIRIATFVNILSLIFGLNVMLFSEHYIEQRAESSSKVKFTLI